MRDERVRNKTNNGGVQSWWEERVRNKPKNGGVCSLRDEQVRNKTNNGGAYYHILPHITTPYRIL